MLIDTTATRTTQFDSVSLTRRVQRPLASLGLAILAVVSFKIFLSAQVGPEVYSAVVGDLALGDVGQQIASRLLGLDPLSQFLADKMQGIMV